MRPRLGHVQGFAQGRINAAKALHKDAKMRPFCKDAKIVSKDAKTRLLASRWIRTPLYLSTTMVLPCNLCFHKFKAIKTLIIDHGDQSPTDTVYDSPGY